MLRACRSSGAVVVALTALAACSGSGNTAERRETVVLTTPVETSAVEITSVESTAVEIPPAGSAPISVDDSDGTVSKEPALSEQCAPGQSPALAAYDINLGALQWLTCSAESGRRSVIGVADDLVYAVEYLPDPTHVVEFTARLIAVDVRDGGIVWQLEVDPSIPVGPFAAAGAVVVTVSGAKGRAVVGVDPATGATRWRAPIDTAEAFATTDTVVLVRSSGSPDVQVPATGLPAAPPPGGPIGFYSALDRASGVPLWSVELSSGNGACVGPCATVDGDTVILLPGPFALDATSGDELWRAAASAGDESLGPVVDGVVLLGGQDDPTTALDASTGATLWTMPGSPAYDDVWAVGDSAMYVLDRATAEGVAYELATGVVRWRREQSFERLPLPWHVAEGTVFAVRSNLHALSTTDGSERWATGYPEKEFPRITGVGSNDTLVVVSFSSQPSGGD